MRKIIVVFALMMMFISSTYASEITPRYKIISSSMNDEDIKEMYKVKESLFKDYKRWIEGVDDIHQVLVDHCYVYNAQYQNNTYIIILGKGNGKSIEGELKVNYCESSKEIKKRSLIVDFFSMFS